MTGDYISLPLRRAVRQRAGDCCELCLLPQWSQEAAFHIDHIRPRAAKGKSKLFNLALACVGCSLCKGVRQSGVDPMTGKSTKLFHPRQDRWSDHFRWTKSWKVVGLTAIARATIQCLQLNRSTLVRIRRVLAEQGCHLRHSS